jgi:hypothetical protein
MLKLVILHSEDADQIVCKCGVKNVFADKWCKNCGRELRALVHA